jgi:hypothetical protein
MYDNPLYEILKIMLVAIPSERLLNNYISF